MKWNARSHKPQRSLVRRLAGGLLGAVRALRWDRIGLIVLLFGGVVALIAWFVLGWASDDDQVSERLVARCSVERSAALPVDYEPSPDWQAGIAETLQRYAEGGADYNDNLANYAVERDYLNWGATLTYTEGETFRFDEQGIPMVNVNQDGTYYYQTVTTAQYALMMHGRWLHGVADQSEFLAAADFLLTLGDGEGGFPMQFPYVYYLTGETLPEGWQSGMTYGHVLSVLARAYLLTEDERYREAGDQALAKMVLPEDEGGTLYTLEGIDPSLSDYIIFEEYPSTPGFYTLNGFMFTMLGLHDWWQIDPEAESGPSAVAHDWFDCSMATLTTMLPLFDVGGMSAYDLGHFLLDVEPNTSPFYHAIHIELLHALGSITGDERLNEFEMRWRSYVDEPPNSERATATSEPTP